MVLHIKTKQILLRLSFPNEFYVVSAFNSQTVKCIQKLAPENTIQSVPVMQKPTAMNVLSAMKRCKYTIVNIWSSKV